jgi:hypothetical protein
MKLRPISMVNPARWLWALGLGLTMQIASAQNAPAPGTTSIPAARPATGNTAAPAQTRPATPSPQPAAAAPKPVEPAKTPPASANTAADAKPAATTPPTTPVATEQAKSGDTSTEVSPKKKAGAEPPPCIVADFRAIGIDTQDAEKRRARALAWIARRGKQCTPQQLLVMRNNRSQWLGTGDSGAAAAAIDALLEGFAADNPDIALLLYGTPPPPPPPPDPKAKPAPAK